MRFKLGKNVYPFSPSRDFLSQALRVKKRKHKDHKFSTTSQQVVKVEFSSIDHPSDCFSKAEWQIVLYVFKIFKDHL